MFKKIERPCNYFFLCWSIVFTIYAIYNLATGAEHPWVHIGGGILHAVIAATYAFWIIPRMNKRDFDDLNKTV